MTRIGLELYTQPGGAEVYINIRRKDGGHERLAAFIDTGAEVSLLPAHFMSFIDYRLSDKSDIIIDQAGIVGQAFRAQEGFIRLFLEDSSGNMTGEFEMPTWFAQTDEILMGFEGFLDRAVLHIDMPRRAGWIELDA